MRTKLATSPLAVWTFAAAAACLASPAFAGSVPATGTTADQLQTITGSESQTDDGDYLSARNALASIHRFFIEVPAGAPRLVVDLFDMDLLAGAGEQALERDRIRTYENFDPDVLATYGDEVFMSVVEYTLLDPNGNAVVAQRRKGSRWAPIPGDNTWVGLYDSATASTTGAADTWRDNFAAAAYSNNNGTHNFAGNWIESQETGVSSSAGPAAGLVRITGGALRLTNAGDIFPYTGRQPGIERELDLSGFTSATVSFDSTVSVNNEKDDIVVFEVSANGGSTWTTLDDISGGVHGRTANYAASHTYDISDFIAANTRVRFRVAYLLANASDNESVLIDNFEIRATNNVAPAPQAGHWEIRVDMSRTLAHDNAAPITENGDETNAYGIRAHDGDATAGGSEFNVYGYVHTDGLNTNDSSRSYTLYPLISSGCDFDAANFDFDADLPSNTAPDPDLDPPFGEFVLTGRIDSYTHTMALLSSNDSWYSENVSLYTNDNDALNYGIWRSDFRIDDPGDGNYVPHYYTDYDAATITPPASNIPADSYRIYLPTDAGEAPAKPYLQQIVRFVNPQPFGASYPPTPGQVARYRVYVWVVNPSGSIGAITFSATRTVTARMPGGLVTYQGLVEVTQGTMISQPTIGSNVAGNLVWNPGTLTAGSGGVDNLALMTYLIDVAPVATPYTIQVVGAPGSGNGTRATWLDETGYDVARSIFSTGELCQLEVQNDTVTPVLVSSFRSVVDRGQVVVEWSTAAEAGALGFDLEREGRGGWLPVNAERLNALLGSPQGGRYRLVDHEARPGQAVRYRLVEHTAAGPRIYGPWLVAAAEPAAQRLDGDFAAAPHAASPRHRQWRDGQGFASDARRQAAAASAAARLKVEVGEAGLYRVSRAALQQHFAMSAAEVDAALRGAGFDLRRAGVQVAWTQGPGLEGLDFYAPGLDTPFTGRDVYTLARGAGLKMLRVAQLAPPAGPDSAYRTSSRFEENRMPVVLLPLDPESDIFFWDFLRPASAAASRDFAFALADPLDGAEPAGLRLELQGGAAGSHVLEVRVNGSAVGEVQVAGTAAAAPELELPAGLLRHGANVLTLRALQGDLVFLEGFAVDHERRHRAPQNVLIGQSTGDRVTVDGFSNGKVRAFDLANPARPRSIASLRVEPDVDNGWQATWRTPSPDFLVLVDAALRTPSLSVDAPSDLRSTANATDYLVITTAALAASAQGLAELRSAQGLATMVVDIEDVYDEFAHGRRDARALRDFLAYASAEWATPPRFVVLAGHGTYDYRDFLGYHNNLIPVLLFDRGDHLYPTDALYADLAGADGAPELRVGRLPVLSAAELDAYVAKLTAYEEPGESGSGESWDDDVVLLADHDADGGDFTGDNAALGRLLPAGYQETELALGAFGDVASARAALFAELGEGAALVHYSGHGAVDRLSAAGWLTSADVAGLAEGGKPTLLTAITCHVGFHGLPTLDSLAEELVLAPAGGAVAVFAPTWLSEDHQARFLGDRLFRALFAETGVLVGDATVQALRAGALEGQPVGLLYAYQLLGDPATRFRGRPLPATPTCTEDCGDG